MCAGCCVIGLWSCWPRCCLSEAPGAKLERHGCNITTEALEEVERVQVGWTVMCFMARMWLLRVVGALGVAVL
jgi:hypothetical protein